MNILLGIINILLEIMNILLGIMNILLGIINILLEIMNILLGIINILLEIMNILLGITNKMFVDITCYTFKQTKCVFNEITHIKLYFSSPYIFETGRCKLLIFQILTTWTAKALQITIIDSYLTSLVKMSNCFQSLLEIKKKIKNFLEKVK